MERFPTGDEWDIGECEDLVDWSKELRTLDPSKELRAIVVSLRSLSAQILHISTPVEFDGETSDDGEIEISKVEPAPNTGTIRVKSRATVPVRAADLPEKFPNDPKVNDYLLSIGTSY